MLELSRWEYLALARECRKLVGERWANRLLLLDKGNKKPVLLGESYYWTTPSGKTRIRHPAAYDWPKTYVPSSLAIHVGEVWARRWLRSHPDLVALARLEDVGDHPSVREARKALRKLRKDPNRAEKVNSIMGVMELFLASRSA